MSFFCFAENYGAHLKYKIKKKILFIVIIIMNANNDRFAVLCNRYFSACDWRSIWCQFVADVKQNPGGGGWGGGEQSQLNIDSIKLAQL